MQKNQQVYFPYFDVVRFYAAFMILILHVYEAWCGWFGEVGINREAHTKS
mgnify:CR=1 FL=1